MNAPQYAENTITAFHMTQENIVGIIPSDKFRYDIPNIILVCLSKNIVEEKDELKLHRLLGILFSDTIPVSDKKRYLEKEFDFLMSREMERRSLDVCNLSEAILARGITQERERMVLSLHEEGMSKDFIMRVAKVTKEELEDILRRNI